jgi:hypothetical protein
MAWPVSRLGSRALSPGLGRQAHAGQAGHTAPAHRCHRARGGQRSLAPRRALVNAGAAFAPAPLARLHGRTGPWRALAYRTAQGVQSPRGGRMPQQTALLGLTAMPRRASRWHGAFGLRARIGRVAARAGAWPLASLGAGLLEVGHATARVDAWRRHRTRAHHPARLRPRPGLLPGRVAARARAALARIGTCGLCDDLVSQRWQATRAGQPGHRREVGWRRAPLPHLGGGTLAVTAKEQQGVRPSLTPTRAPPWHHAAPLRRPDALGLAKRGQQATCAARIAVEGQTAIAALRARVTARLLRAMRRGLGVIAVEDDARGGPGVRGATWLHKPPRQAGECGA